MSKFNIGVIVAAILLAGIVGYTVLGSKDSSVKDTAIASQDSTGATVKEAPSTGIPGTYASYSTDATEEAIARGDDVVLSFSAAWCPSCVQLKRNLNAGVIPEGLTILEVNYDDSTDLKKKHGVTFQHTLVQINDDQDSIVKWAGSLDAKQIVAELQ